MKSGLGIFAAPVDQRQRLFSTHPGILSQCQRLNNGIHATLEWVDWFIHRRLLEPIGNIPPAELEMAYYRQLEESAMVA